MPRPPTLDLDAPPAGQEPAPVVLARAFLAGGPVPTGLPDEVADALCDALARRGDADRLGELARTGDKPLAKRARKSLHLLRSRGVQAEIPQAAVPARAAAAEPEEEIPALVSVAIRDGERLLWYVRHHDTGGLEVFQARTTELEGLTRFEVGVLPRRQWREAEGDLLADPVLQVTRVPRPWVRWLLEEAHQRAVDAGRTPPRRYAEVRHLIERAEPPARHPAHELCQGATASGGSERVLTLPEARTWIPDEKLARQAYNEIEKLAESPLVLDERQRKDQIHEILRRTAAEALAGPWRARLERRLLDTAAQLAWAARAPRDRARDYLADAAACIAAAAEVADPARGPDEIVLVRTLFDLLIPNEAAPAPGGPAPEPPGKGLIITP